jgi:D-beta-D-heptose 7-phosphate kinase/D-beta-D-heptose 1-phosphate adenosyltransferase
MEKKKRIVVTGGFDPVHQGHIAYFEAAKKLGDTLIVGLNSDGWLCRKKVIPFMTFEERHAVIAALRCVDIVLEINDRDNTAKDAIVQAQAMFPDDTIVFANGGDRTAKNIPEMDIAGVEFVFGVGGSDKANSSSDILGRYREYILTMAERESGPYLRYT